MTVSSDGLVLWWDIRMFGEYTAKLAADKSQEIIESLPLKEKSAEHSQVSKLTPARTMPFGVGVIHDRLFFSFNCCHGLHACCAQYGCPWHLGSRPHGSRFGAITMLEHCMFSNSNR